MKRITKIHGDGGSRGNPGPAASAFVVYNGDEVIYEEGKYLGHTTNNVAEYNCVLLALEWLKENSDKDNEDIDFFLDSELVVRQLTGVYRIKSPHLKPLAVKVKSLESSLPFKVNYHQVKREFNSAPDLLVNQKLDAVSE